MVCSPRACTVPSDPLRSSVCAHALSTGQRASRRAPTEALTPLQMEEDREANVVYSSGCQWARWLCAPGPIAIRCLRGKSKKKTTKLNNQGKITDFFTQNQKSGCCGSANLQKALRQELEMWMENGKNNKIKEKFKAKR